MKSQRHSRFRWRVHTAKKMIFERNPIMTVGKWAGLFLCGLKKASQSRCELRERWRIGDYEPFVRRRKARRSMRRFSLFYCTDRFERAVSGWALSHRRRKFHFARDQIGGFEFPVAGQCPRVAPYIAEQKFNWPRECHGISFAPTPPCL